MAAWTKEEIAAVVDKNETEEAGKVTSLGGVARPKRHRLVQVFARRTPCGNEMDRRSMIVSRSAPLARLISLLLSLIHI